MQNNVTLNSVDDSLNDVTLKSRVYDWIKYLCTNHKLEVSDIPVMVSINYVTLKFGISKRQALRIMDSLIEEKKIYRYKIYNKSNIYSLRPMNLNKDLLVRIRPNMAP